MSSLAILEMDFRKYAVLVVSLRQPPPKLGYFTLFMWFSPLIAGTFGLLGFGRAMHILL
jgi:hypothetical protein